MTLTLAAFLFLGFPGGQSAMQQTEPNCPGDAAPIPAELTGWQARTPLAAATDMAGLAGATIAPGKAVDLALRPTPEVRYVLRPERPGGSVSNGGMLRITIAAAGTYRVGIGSAAWLDMVRDGAALESVGHGRGPACSGIRKMVDFALQPGDYVLQLVGNGTPTMPVIVTRLP